MTPEDALEIMEHDWTRIVNRHYKDEDLDEAREAVIKALRQQIDEDREEK